MRSSFLTLCWREPDSNFESLSGILPLASGQNEREIPRDALRPGKARRRPPTKVSWSW
jgi:hypothetical protein